MTQWNRNRNSTRKREINTDKQDKRINSKTTIDYTMTFEAMRNMNEMWKWMWLHQIELQCLVDLWPHFLKFHKSWRSNRMLSPVDSIEKNSLQFYNMAIILLANPVRTWFQTTVVAPLCHYIVWKLKKATAYSFKVWLSVDLVIQQP